MNRFLSVLSLILILANGAGHLAAALAFGPEHGPGWDGLYCYAQLAVLLAVWSLAPDRRTYVYLTLAAAFTALTSGGPLWMIRQDPLFLGMIGAYVIFFQWLLAALCAASAAARRLPEDAPDLGWFKVFALILAACGLAFKAALFLLPADPAAIPTSEAALNAAENLEIRYLITSILFWFIPPLWLMKAAGRRTGPVFAAGLGLALPPLLAVWFLAADRMEHIGPTLSLLREMAMFNQMIVDMLLTLFILAALISLAALVRVRRGRPEPKGVSQFKLTAALIPAGALILACFLALGWHRGQVIPEAAPWAGPLKTVKFADMEIKVPADFNPLGLNFNLKLDGHDFSFNEWVWDSADETNRRMGYFLKLKVDGDEETLARLREFEAGDAEADSELAGFFKKGVLTGLGRDLSAEMGRPARLTVAVENKWDLDRQDIRPRLNLSLVVRYGETGLVRLEERRIMEFASDEDNPELAAAQAEAVEEFLGQARSFFQNYQWLGPEGDTSGPGWYTRFGRLSRPPDDYLFLHLHFYKRRQRMMLNVRRESKSRLAEGLNPPRFRRITAGEVISFYYIGGRIQAGPLTAAGQPGRVKVHYPARPAVFPTGYTESGLWCEWFSEDEDAFPWEITLNVSDTAEDHLSGPELLGLWQTVISSFRYVGDSSTDAPDISPTTP